MIIQDRHARILAKLQEKDFVEVGELSESLQVSVETIRRDLNTLESANLLRRVHGGAVSLVSSSVPASSSSPVQSFKAAALPASAAPTDCAWFSPARPPFRLYGFPFYETDGVYRRYPLNPPLPLPPAVEDLAWCSSGGQIHFHAKTSQVYIRVKTAKPAEVGYNLLPLSGSGFDLYASDGDGIFTLCGVTRFDPASDCYESKLLKMEEPKELDLIIHFPINTRVESILIGLDRDCVPQSPVPFANQKRILIYGGSIMHGFCASRPGMTMPNILSRRLNREVINMGVNGNAKCEREAALAVRMVKNVEWFIISPEGNAPSVDWLRQHMTEFIRLYREANPDVKIVVMSYMRESRERFDDFARRLRLSKKQCQMEIVESFRAQGDSNIFFWDGEEFSAGDEDIVFDGFHAAEECTTDTQHKSDLGFWMMANAICRRLQGN